MNGLLAMLFPLLAQESTSTGAVARFFESLRDVRFDFPETGLEWLLYGGGFALAFALVIWLYLRDGVEVGRGWTGWLTFLRLGTLLAILLIALNPHRREERKIFRPSRVALVVDTSLSMRYPEKAVPSGVSQDTVDSRATAIARLLKESPLLEKLREQHEVSIYTFDSELAGPHMVLTSRDPRAAINGTANGAAENKSDGTTTSQGSGEATSEDAAESAGDDDALLAAVNWDEVLDPSGLDSRMGESLHKLIGEVAGKTLSGIVVVSDGQSNAGVSPDAAHAEARKRRVRLVTVGVGSTEKPINLKVASVQAPTDVHVGDAYDISAYVQGQGLAGRTVEVQLMMRAEGDDGEPVPVEPTPTQPNPVEVTLQEDGVPAEVRFERVPESPASLEYFVRARPVADLREQDLADNEIRKSIRIIDRKTRVLLIAGGPTREYRFVRNMLYRHPAIDVHLWLQSVDPTTAGQVSQESNRPEGPLTEFPATAAELYEYDAIIAFDPDWSAVSEEGLKLLVDWVGKHAGGLIVVAGDVYTRELAASDAPTHEAIKEMYPVFLNSFLLDFQFDTESDQPWPIDFTREGRDAGFLHLTEDPATSESEWNQFPGIYRVYPTAGAKSAATVYAHFSDPRSQTEYGPHVLMAMQFYLAGRVFYLGSGEMWRLRALTDEYYDRFWTKLVREVAQGRLKRGSKPGMLLLERTKYILGQTVRVRAQLLNARREPLEADSVSLTVYQPDGKPLIPDRRLLRDKTRPGQFVGDFRAGMQGTYRLELPIPESNDVLNDPIDVTLPSLESDNTEQNARLLTNLSRDTGGRYLPLEEATEGIPPLMTNRSEEIIVDERLQTLWDKQWVMYLLICLLSMEWLTRKLLKLA